MYVVTDINSKWPELDYAMMKNTLQTVHLYTQVVGKIRLRSMPWINHSWHVTLYVTPSGLTTGSMPYKDGLFEIAFNFLEHRLVLTALAGQVEIPLMGMNLSGFQMQVLTGLEELGVSVTIHGAPNEVEPAIPFAEDETPREYDRAIIERYFLSLLVVHKAFTKFRAGFKGKCSPVHLFWGAFDLAVTRFSGREAPPHAGGAPNMPVDVMQEAYSQEVSSCGFWPGSDAFPNAAFYAYCYPTPEAFGKQPVQPKEAFYSDEMGEFFLLYDVVRKAADPEKMLLQFLQSTYEAAANTGGWNRQALECDYSWLKKPLRKSNEFK